MGAGGGLAAPGVGAGRTGRTACAWVGLGDGPCGCGMGVKSGLEAGRGLWREDEDGRGYRLEMRALTREEKKRLGKQSGCTRGKEDADGHCGGRRAHTRAGAGTWGRRSKGLSWERGWRDWERGWRDGREDVDALWKAVGETCLVEGR